jgi:CubicO group peptidase (beta-lactamase class C family)
LIVLLPMQAQAQADNCPDPTGDWQERSPGELGIDAARLAEGEATIEEALPYLRSLVVVRHGCLAYERYFGDAAADTLFNSYSVTKSVTATLIGIAIAERKIGSLRDPIADYLTAEVPPAKRRITIDNLLKMLSGIGWDEDRAEDISGMLALNRDEVGYILELPQVHRPGSFWNYSTADSHLLSAVLTGATGESAFDYATSHLFAPLGIAGVRWTQDANGINLGGTQVFWRARDMAKFGLLYLNGGVWDDQRIVPAEWIEYVTTPQLADPTIYELAYGAHWWIVSLPGYPRMYAASGYGGQYIIVAPHLDAVIVTTANSYIQPPNIYIAGDTALAHGTAILHYVRDVVLPAFTT